MQGKPRAGAGCLQGIAALIMIAFAGGVWAKGQGNIITRFALNANATAPRWPGYRLSAFVLLPPVLAVCFQGQFFPAAQAAKRVRFRGERPKTACGHYPPRQAVMNRLIIRAGNRHLAGHLPERQLREPASNSTAAGMLAAAQFAFASLKNA